MLSKQNRISENRDFLKIFKTIRPVHTEHLAIRVAYRPNNPLPRFGFVVSNKIDKRSNRRNGLKRRIRAVIENRLGDIKPGIDAVVQVKKPLDYPYHYEAIEREVLDGLARAGLIK